MKQTPLQRLIEELERDQEIAANESVRAGVERAIKEAKSLLPYEREVIEEAHGTKKKYGSQIDPEIITGSDYYTQTFTDES